MARSAELNDRTCAACALVESLYGPHAYAEKSSRQRECITRLVAARPLEHLHFPALALKLRGSKSAPDDFIARITILARASQGKAHAQVEAPSTSASQL